MNMRELITLVEQAQPDVATLSHLLDHIHDFVTRGPIEDRLMDDVWQHWPRPSAPMMLWRVINLNAEQVELLPAGLDIPTYRYLSWTSDQSCVRRLAHARANRGPVAVIHMMIPADRICVSISDFIDQLHEF